MDRHFYYFNIHKEDNMTHCRRRNRDDLDDDEWVCPICGSSEHVSGECEQYEREDD